MMLWLVTFMSVIPAGLLLARNEHVSIIHLEKESVQEEEKLEAQGDASPDPLPSAPKENAPPPDKWIH